MRPRRHEYRLEVDVVRLARADEAAGRVDQNLDARVLERPDDSRRHLGPALREARVHGRQYDVQLAQDLGREVQRPVGEDVALAAREDSNLEARLERPERPDLLAQPVDAQTARHGRGRRVVGDDDVLVAARLGRLDELLDRMVAVRPVGVRVQVAADPVGGHQPRQGARERGLDLSAIFAELGWDPREPHRRVHVGLGRASDPGAGRLVEDAVLADLELAARGHLAEADVVVLGTGEVLEGGAQGVGVDDPEVDLDPRAVVDRRLGAAGADDVQHRRERDERLDHARGVGGGREEVDVLHGLACPPERARDLDALHPCLRRERRDDLPRDRARLRERCAGAASPPDRDALQDVVAGLVADAGDGQDLARLAHGLEAVDRVDGEPVEQEFGRLRPEAADLEQGEKAGWDLTPEGLELRDRAGLQELGDARREVLAHPGDLLQLAACGDGRQLLRQRLDTLGGTLVGAHAEAALAADLEQARHLAEEAGHVEVRHGAMIHSARPASMREEIE